MEIKKLYPEPEVNDHRTSEQLKWLNEGNLRELENGSYILRALVNRVNQLIDKVAELEQKIAK